MSTTTIFQVGSYNSLTDAFTLVLDLNDRSTWYLDTLELAQPEKVDTRAFNIRTPGEVVERVQYKNRKIQATMWLRGSTTAALLASIRSFIAAVEHPPYVVRLQLPNGSQYSYADVVRVTHDLPFDAKAWLAGALGAAGKKRVHVIFECLPGLRGDRVVLSNAVTNPGFEAPSGPAVTVFNDPLTNFNAYSVQAGGALAQDKLSYPDVLTQVAGANLLRYYRLDESSGTVAYDASPTVNNGTTHGSPTQGVAGGLTGDTDTCYTFASASSQYVSSPSTGLPTGNAAVSIVALVKFAANPASNKLIWGFGNVSTNHQGFNGYINTSGKFALNNGSAGTTITSVAALTMGVFHLVAATWDGTTMSLYVDNVAAVTATPGAQAIPASPVFNIGADAVPSTYFDGQIDEVALVGTTALTSGNITSLYNAFHVAPAVTANTMLIPSGGRESFGSPAWGALNLWQVRWRYVSGLTATFYAHYTDANNYLAVVVTGTALTINHVVGGTTHQLGTQSLALVNGIFYWLQVTQFPTVVGNPPNVQAQNFVDNGGALGSVTGGLLGPFATFDAVTALSGKPQIAASGAALGLGGAFSNVHTVGLFGPGGWSVTPAQNAVTGYASGAWEGTRGEIGMSGTATAGTQTYGSGPVTSFGSARIDLPPAGSVDATWHLYAGGAAAGTSAIPVQTATNVLGYSAWVKESGLNAAATVELTITEYNASGSATGSSSLTLGALTGGALPTVWTQLSGTYTTHANCAYVDFGVRVVDTAVAGESANATVWIDNLQVWDQTRTGMTSMPYCELTFPQNPAQLVVSGLVGDMAAPSVLEIGLYYSTWSASQVISVYCGRRVNSSQNAHCISPVLRTNSGITFVLDSASYGGFYQSSSAAPLLGLIEHHPGDISGTYHYFQRVQIASMAAGAVTSLGVQTMALVRSTPLNASSVTDTNYLADVRGSVVYPWTATGKWLVVDTGQVQLPPTPPSSLNDPTQNYVDTQLNNAPAGGASASSAFANWVALLPVDGEMVAMAVTNYSGGARTAQWLFSYRDGVAVTAAWSIEASPIPAPAHSGGQSAASNIFAPELTSGGDSIVYLDPRTVAYPATTPGVNQFVLIAADDAGNSLPTVAELVFSPLYLFPR